MSPITRLLCLVLLCLPLTAACGATSANMPLIPPAAFVTATYTELGLGVESVVVDITYWKTAAPFFVFGFARTELSNTVAQDSDFKNMWDRDWTRLKPVDSSRPKAHREHTVDELRAFLNVYVIAWESTTGNELREYRFCGSQPVGEPVDRVKLERCDQRW